jgi:hypothetical protein
LLNKVGRVIEASANCHADFGGERGEPGQNAKKDGLNCQRFTGKRLNLENLVVWLLWHS